MSETIYKNDMIRNYQNYRNIFQAKQREKSRVQSDSGRTEASSYVTNEGDSFRDVVNKYEAQAVVSEAYQTRQPSTQDMSMEEYKTYISNRLSRLPVHPSQRQDTVAIQISEAGFEAMKNDPEYEEWVIGWLGQDFACRDPWSGICGGKYVVHFVGATKEEYRGQSWYPQYQNGTGKNLFDQKSEGSFWQRRMDRHREYQKQYERKVQSREVQARQIQRQMQMRQMLGWQDISLQDGGFPLAAELFFGGMLGGGVNI